MPSAPTRESSPAKPQFLQAENLTTLPWLVHGFSTRRGGVSRAYGGNALNLGITQHDTREAVEQNRTLFRQAVGAVDGDGRAWPLVIVRQIHSGVVHCIQERPRQVLAGDGLITDRPGLLLTVRTADCLPILLVDPERRAVGVLHAGWRGTLARIAEKGVGEMRLRFGSDPAAMRAAIGPGIHACCYQVGEEVREKFTAQFAYAGVLFRDVFGSDPVRERYPLLFLNQRAPGHGEPPRTLRLDLVEANRRQLLAAGVNAAHIWASDLCTACHTDRFFSHRAEKGVTGRMMGAVGIREIGNL
jgi:YfiH family protein